jgi:hypothetical protein
MRPTEHLLASPYIMGVMRELGGVWGRSRLMGLAAGAEVPAHIDCHYYWRTHLRIHIPVITNPGVLFTCGDETVHMKAGECWVFDSFQRHDVQNKGTERRIHLVLDTIGGNRLWDLVEAGQSNDPPSPRLLAPSGSRKAELVFERTNAPKVMSPWEMQVHVDFLTEHLEPDARAEQVLRRLDRFINAWGAAWAHYEVSDKGLPTYKQLIADVREGLAALGGEEIALRNKVKLYFALDQIIFLNAIERPPAAKLVTAGPRGIDHRIAS